MPISIPSDIAVDLRQPVVGDSFNWEDIEPAAAKSSIVIHGTASESPVEDGFTVADYHVNHNGWGGVGVHAVCTKDSYPGRAGYSAGGVQLHYVGDLLTWRAGTANQNETRIHVEISGLFTPGHGVPSEGQLRKVRAFIDHMLFHEPAFSSLQYYSQVTYHNAVPEQQTACPGWQHPQFPEWFAYLQGGAEPSWWHVAPIAPTPPPTPDTPVEASDLVPGQGGGTNEYEVTYHEQAETKPITRPGAFGIDVSTGFVTVPTIAEGTVIDIAGYFQSAGHTYARTVYSATHNKWNGLDVIYLTPITGQLTGEIPISHPDTATPAPDPIVIPDPTVVQTGVTDAELTAATVPDAPSLTVWQLIKELVAQIIARLIKRNVKK